MERAYGIQLTQISDIHDMDCIIIAVAHNQYKKMSVDELLGLYGKINQEKKRIMIDIKGCQRQVERVDNVDYWSL